MARDRKVLSGQVGGLGRSGAAGGTPEETRGEGPPRNSWLREKQAPRGGWDPATGGRFPPSSAGVEEAVWREERGSGRRASRSPARATGEGSGKTDGRPGRGPGIAPGGGRRRLERPAGGEPGPRSEGGLGRALGCGGKKGRGPAAGPPEGRGREPEPGGHPGSAGRGDPRGGPRRDGVECRARSARKNRGTERRRGANGPAKEQGAAGRVVGPGRNGNSGPARDGGRRQTRLRRGGRAAAPRADKERGAPVAGAQKRRRGLGPLREGLLGKGPESPFRSDRRTGEGGRMGLGPRRSFAERSPGRALGLGGSPPLGDQRGPALRGRFPLVRPGCGRRGDGGRGFGGPGRAGLGP